MGDSEWEGNAPPMSLMSSDGQFQPSAPVVTNSFFIPHTHQGTIPTGEGFIGNSMSLDASSDQGNNADTQQHFAPPQRNAQRPDSLNPKNQQLSASPYPRLTEQVQPGAVSSQQRAYEENGAPKQEPSFSVYNFNDPSSRDRYTPAVNQCNGFEQRKQQQERSSASSSSKVNVQRPRLYPSLPKRSGPTCLKCGTVQAVPDPAFCEMCNSLFDANTRNGNQDLPVEPPTQQQAPPVQQPAEQQGPTQFLIATGPRTPPQPLRARRSSFSSTNAPGSWECEHCTYLNRDPESRVCEVCSKTRGVFLTRTPEVPEPTPEPKPKLKSERQEVVADAPQPARKNTSRYTSPFKRTRSFSSPSKKKAADAKTSQPQRPRSGSLTRAEEAMMEQPIREWECVFCTYMNQDVSKRICEVCAKTRGRLPGENWENQEGTQNNDLENKKKKKKRGGICSVQ